MARLNGFALNAFTTHPLSLEEDAAVCRTLRVEALELTENKLAMDYFAELGLRGLPVVLISGAAPDYDFRHAWETAPSWFREATAHPQARGFRWRSSRCIQC